MEIHIEIGDKMAESNVRKSHKILEKIPKIIYELHIYSSFKETLFKFLIFSISWIGAVFCYYKAQVDNVVFGGAVLIYALSYLAEFGFQLNPRNSFWKKIFPFLIVLWSVLMGGIGAALLFNKRIDFFNNNTIIGLCVIPNAIYLLDILLFYWVAGPKAWAENCLKDGKGD